MDTLVPPVQALVVGKLFVEQLAKQFAAGVLYQFAGRASGGRVRGAN